MSLVSAPNSSTFFSIRLESRRGRAISNAQCLDVLPLYYHKAAQDLLAKYAGQLFRTGATKVYNCHGLTFASRRTQIDASAEVLKVLADDNYVRVKIEEVLPGDVVLWIKEDTSDVEHSGVVVEYAHGTDFMPRILSKWGPFQEVVHWLNKCPYEGRVEYYRYLP